MWDDCQQLLQVIFTTKERGRIVLEAHKLVPGPNGEPTVDPAIIDMGFPTIWPNWDHNTAEGKERLKIYCQTLLAGLKAAARWPANMSKVYGIRRGAEESPAAFLECLQEAFR